jgi:hypothetical protein
MANRYCRIESEATYGTVPATGANTQFLPIESETLTAGQSNEFVIPETIQYTTPNAALQALGKYKHTGTISGFQDHNCKNWTLVLKGLMGDGTTAQQGGTAAYTQTFVPYAISDTIESISVGIGPGGQVQDGAADVELLHNGVGVRSMTWEWSAGEKVALSADLVVKSVDDAPLTTPTYVDATTAYGSAPSRTLTGSDVNVYRDISGDDDPTNETAVADIMSGSITITNPFDDDAYACGSREMNGLYLDGYVEVSGEFTMAWKDLEMYQLFWGADDATSPHATTFVTTNTAMVVEMGGEHATLDLADTGYYYGLDFDLPEIRYTTISSGLDSMNRPTQTIVWQAMYDATDGYAVQVVATNKETDMP